MTFSSRRPFVLAHVEREFAKLQYIRVMINHSRDVLSSMADVLRGMIACDETWCSENLALCALAIERAKNVLEVNVAARQLKQEHMMSILHEYQRLGYIRVVTTPE